MTTKPIAHKWHHLPVHGGPDEWRCGRCGIESTFQDGTAAPPPFCVPRVGSITPHPEPVTYLATLSTTLSHV